MKCSKYSGEGRVKRDPGPTTPTVAPPHRNLRGEEERRIGMKKREGWKERESERSFINLIHTAEILLSDAS